ncbi:PaiB family negative transcriptional regulator [Aliiruegeria haliotis]|uniref:PaiB family negative transcriptional regulator n=1 Tax=Aliiruegeria haliotis TaxID=1280846 RepID=A0A2T0RJB0_9RHOB|nr:FMN-binding negative transcriptional regulator [Aliiruegeria haliotis]PRY21238.1 PaiB family negative transcriptional regulator [Aliiruegeria haliotis]
MHPNPAFRTTTQNGNLQFARERGFGQLTVAKDGLPLVAHVPFALTDSGDAADLHLVRSNPVARALTEPTPALIAISGPDSYISPDWYGIDDQVPTWNYVAVHLRGTLIPLPQEDLRKSLDRLSLAFEARLEPKPAWTAAKMPADLLDRLMRSIRPFRFEIETVDGTWKLTQNKVPEARMAAADHVDAYGIGQETRLLAALMRGASE